MGQRHAYGAGVAQPDKVPGREDPPPLVADNGLKYRSSKGLHGASRIFSFEKRISFFQKPIKRGSVQLSPSRPVVA
jgi:hypothetical protein